MGHNLRKITRICVSCDPSLYCFADQAEAGDSMRLVADAIKPTLSFAAYHSSVPPTQPFAQCPSQISPPTPTKTP